MKLRYTLNYNETIYKDFIIKWEDAELDNNSRIIIIYSKNVGIWLVMQIEFNHLLKEILILIILSIITITSAHQLWIVVIYCKRIILMQSIFILSKYSIN